MLIELKMEIKLEIKIKNPVKQLLQFIKKLQFIKNYTLSNFKNKLLVFPQLIVCKVNLTLTIIEIKIIMNQQFQCTKIKDGLYIGNIVAAHDYQFLMSNKFGFVVNCTSQIPNVFQHEKHIKYLKFKLIQNKPHKLWDQTLKKLYKLQKFLQQAEQNSLCCLIHSFHGQNRSLVFVLGYLMKKYQWRLKKCLDFVKSKQIFVGLSNHYISQLEILQQILTKQSILSLAWTPPYLNLQEQILSKTYLNSLQLNQNTLMALKNEQNTKKKSQKRLVWLDRYEKKKAKQEQLLRKEKIIQRQRQWQKQKHSFKLSQKQKTLQKQKIQQKRLKQKQIQNLKHKTATHIQTQKISRGNQHKKLSFVQAQNITHIQAIKAKNQGINFQSLKSNKTKHQNLKQQQNVLQISEQQNQNRQKNIYQFTINNFISPNFNIINKTQQLVKKSKNQQKQFQKIQKFDYKQVDNSKQQKIKSKEQKHKLKQKKKQKESIHNKSSQKIKRAHSQKQVASLKQIKELFNPDFDDEKSQHNKDMQAKQINKSKEKKSFTTKNKQRDIKKQLKKQIQKVQKQKYCQSTNSLHLTNPITNLAHNLIKNQQIPAKRSVTPTKKQRKKQHVK